ncbi:MAG: hypothetical protein ACKOU7_13510 [Ferruginibacter sp.]
MDIKKLLMGGITGGVLFFLLGWLIYGILLMNFMTSHPGIAGNIARPEPDFLYLIIGNLAMGFLMAFIFIKANVNSMTTGFITAAVIGLLMGVGYDCMAYATSTILSRTGMAADVAASTVMSALTGAIVGAVLGMGKKTA